MKSVFPPRKDSGISLLEVMVALAIIAMVAALVAPRVMGSFGRAKSKAAEIQLTNIKGALQLYYLDVGQYPSETDGLSGLLTQPTAASNWNGPYIDNSDDIQDPWGRPIRYTFPTENGGFGLLSLGRDGQPGGTQEDKDIEG
ncbi:MAG: type II secretion system major pseudopilin GspG [Litorimonas sp.]